jgi:[acyl-carrier-protein] S-malonyltransferase
MGSEWHRHAWLFPGQGSQEMGMGRALLDRFAPAREVLTLAEEISGHPLVELMQRGPESRLTQTDVLQPALVAVSVAYVELLRSCGQEPLAIAGHSLGEIAALYSAGVIGLHDALRLGTERGRFMNEAADGGGMAAIKDLAPDVIEQILPQVGGVVVIANYNATGQTVISGELAALDAVTPLIAEAGGTSVRLNVSGAWHSPLVQQAAQKFEAVLDTVEFSDPQCPLVLGATGDVAQSAVEVLEVMRRQIVSPVRWTKVVQTLLALGADKFLEVGPGKVLRGLLRRNIDSSIRYDVAGVDNSRAVNNLLALVAPEA